MTKKLVPFIQSVALLTFVWLIFFGIAFFLNRNTDPTEYNVPRTATFQLQIDGKKLINDVAFNTFIDQQEDGLNDVLFRLIQEKTEDPDRKLVAGIDVLNTISYFTDEFNGKIVQGIIFKLSNPVLWDKNGEKIIVKNAYAERKGTTGLLVFSENLSKTELKNYVSKSDFSKPRSNSLEKSQLQLSYHSHTLSILEQLNSSISYENNFIHSKGTLNHTFQSNQSEFNLEKKDFHLKTSILPKQLNDTIIYFAKQIGLEIPEIRSFSMNYSGLELVSTDNGMIPFPFADFILEFNEPFSIGGNLERFSNTEVVDFKFSKTSMILEIGNKKYHCKQLSPKSIYIGLSQQPKIIKNSSTSPVEIHGNPNLLLNIKGSKWVVGAIKMSPHYSILESVMKEMENIELSTRQKSLQKLNYSINLAYKSDKKALNEVLKLLLNQ